MIVGVICYATDSGLGHLARSFYRAGIVNRIMLVPHPHYENHHEWYPEGVRYDRYAKSRFLDGLDCLLAFENAFHWDVAREAKGRGVRFALMPMYEYSPMLPCPVAPDVVLCPSDLDYDYFHERYNCARIEVPVEVPWQLRERARVFVHNAGHGQRGWAKGTPQLLEALEYVESPVKLLLRLQPGEARTLEMVTGMGKRSRGFRKGRSGESVYDVRSGNVEVEVRYGNLPEEELFAMGDVFINAEQYNGLSLPLREARAAGMLVVTTNRYPTNRWLPNECLIEPFGTVKDRTGGNCVEFERSVVDPVEIAKVIDRVYDTDIREYSESGRVWAERNSWEALKPEYLRVLKG